MKVITKDLGDKYYKQKGVVIQIIDKYAGVIKLLETGHKLKLDQDHLETVIPSPGEFIVIYQYTKLVIDGYLIEYY